MTHPLNLATRTADTGTTTARTASTVSDADQLLARASQLGVPNMERLAQQLSPVLRSDPAHGAELLGELRARLPAADRTRLSDELSRQVPEGTLHGEAPKADPAAIAAQKQELALDLVQIGLTLTGIVDPTPISDGLDGLISVFRGDWLGAGISVVSMVPYIGDAAKLGKLGAIGRTVERAVDLAKVDFAYARTIAPALEKIRGALDQIPLDALPAPARQAIEGMKTKIDELAAIGPKPVTTRVGRNDVSWTVDADGRTVSAHADLREIFDHAKRTGAEREAQAARGALGEADDVGGHIIGHRFIKAHGEKNIFPQNTQFNNSAYRTMENEWADWIRSGHELSVDVKLIGDGVRPDRVEVFYKVVDPANGKTVFKNSADFANEAGQVFDRVRKSDMK
jgi:hypothetical protein